MIVYADVLFAGDRDPSLPPRQDRDVLLHGAVAIGIGVLVYAVLSMLWHRIVAKSIRAF